MSIEEQVEALRIAVAEMTKQVAKGMSARRELDKLQKRILSARVRAAAAEQEVEKHEKLCAEKIKQHSREMDALLNNRFKKLEYEKELELKESFEKRKSAVLADYVSENYEKCRETYPRLLELIEYSDAQDLLQSKIAEVVLATAAAEGRALNPYKRILRDSVLEDTQIQCQEMVRKACVEIENRNISRDIRIKSAGQPVTAHAPDQ